MSIFCQTRTFSTDFVSDFWKDLSLISEYDRFGLKDSNRHTLKALIF